MTHCENGDTSVSLRYNRHKNVFSFRPERSAAEKSSCSYRARLLLETLFQNLMAHCENGDTSVSLRYNRHKNLFFISTKTKCRGEIFVLVSGPIIN